MDIITQDERDEIRDTIDEAVAKIGEAVELLEGARRALRDSGFPGYIAGQLDAYTIPTLQRFAGPDYGEHQPGNLYALGHYVQGENA